MAFPFSDTTNNTGIVQDIDYNCETNSVSYPLKDKARNTNRWLYRVIAWMFESMPGWEWDDSNLTTEPISRTDLNAAGASQSQYSLPAEGLRFKKVWVLTNTGEKNFLQTIDYSEYLELISTTPIAGLPEKIAYFGASVYIYPPALAAQVTQTNGLQFAISREPDTFISTDTIQEAGIPEPFCRILSLGPSYDYWLKYDIQRANQYLAQIETIKHDLTKFNATRVEEIHAQLIPASARRTRLYM